MTAYRYEDLALRLQAGGGEESDLVALAKERATTVDYVVLEAAADHARLRAFRDNGTAPVIDELLDGDHEYIHEAVSGGPSHLRHAHHTEEVWERNARLFAGAVDRIVVSGGIDFVMVTGDPHVVDIVSGALSFDSREHLVTLAHDTVAPGASGRERDERLDEEILATRTARLQSALDGLLAQASVADRTGLAAVVAELQEASVATLFVDESALAGHTLFAPADPPWIAQLSDSALPESPALDALVRAAILTGSELCFVSPGSLPDGAAVAATTRWAPDGQGAMPTTAADTAADGAELRPVLLLAPAPHLTSHHRNTLKRILQHPSGHNIEWRDARSLLDQAGIVREAEDGGITVTLGGETETIDRPHSKDLTVQDVVDLRRMLVAAGFDQP